MRLLSSRTMFRVWASLAAPLLLTVIWVLFRTNAWWGLAFLACVLLWFYDMGATTCSRCSSYGTWQCGVQGKLIPLFFRKRSMRNANRWRVRMHRVYDLLMMIFAISIFSTFPWMMAITIVWFIVGLLVVYGPERHHGLLHLLRTKTTNHADIPSNLVTLQNPYQPLDLGNSSVENQSEKCDRPYHDERSKIVKSI